MKKPIVLIFFLLISIFLWGQIEPAIVNYGIIRPLSELNQDGVGEGYGWVSEDGLRIYYTTPVEDWQNEIVTAVRGSLDDEFAGPISLNLESGEYEQLSAWLPADELSIYYVTREPDSVFINSLFVAERSSIENEFGSGQKITLNSSRSRFISAPSLTSDTRQLYIYNSDDEAVENILVFERTDEFNYEEIGVIEMPEGLEAKPGNLSHDGLTYYFGASESGGVSYKIYFVNRQSLNDAFTDFYVIEDDDINATELQDHQPHFSSDKRFMIFTRTPDNIWNGNDLYFTQRKIPSSVQDFKDIPVLNVSPNPASEKVNVELGAMGCTTGLAVTIMDAGGKTVSKRQVRSNGNIYSINVSQFAQGLYYLQFKCENGSLGVGKFLKK